MQPKLIGFTLLVLSIAAGLLALRHQRTQLAHRTAELHEQIQQTRHRIWRQQARAAELTTPDALNGKLQKARIALEPAVPMPAAPGSRWARTGPTAAAE